MLQNKLLYLTKKGQLQTTITKTFSIYETAENIDQKVETDWKVESYYWFIMTWIVYYDLKVTILRKISLRTAS